MDKIACLVTGSRKFDSKPAVHFRMTKYPPGTIFIHGDATGADTLCHIVCQEMQYPEVKVPYFSMYGKAGGPIRNQFMFDVLSGLWHRGYELGVEAFPLPDSRGTKNMISIVKKTSVPIWVFGEDDRNLPAAYLMRGK